MKENISAATQNYIAFLRGINVGGHHKVPMAVLKKEMERMGCTDVITLLNSGNVIFKSNQKSVQNLEKEIAIHLEENFQFHIPVIVRKGEEVLDLVEKNPFKKIDVDKDIRLYISFLKVNPNKEIKISWTCEDNSYQILERRNKNVFSVLDLSKTKTVKGMEVLEQLFGKNITTRNWNTLLRIAQKL